MNTHTWSPKIDSNAEAKSQTGRVAGFLRIIGALAIGGSGLLYMLQGLYHTEANLRNWVYLALMAALGVGGIFSQRAMADSKGARVCFALAALLIPVQFSQLGGMVLNYFSDVPLTNTWFAVSAPVFTTLLLFGSLSIAAALTLSFLGFSILTRGAATPLTAAFVVMNLGMLLPVRDSFLAAPVIIGLFAVTALLEIRIFRRQVIFQTFEGISVRVLMLLPLTIVICRNSFHISDVMGTSAILGMGGFIFHYLTTCEGAFNSSRYLREFLRFIAFALLILALPTFSYELFGQPQKFLSLDRQWLSVVYTLPALACALYFSSRSDLLSPFYQLAATAVLCIAIAWVLDSRYLGAEFALWCAALAMVGQGFLHRQKITFVSGVVTAICLGAHLLYSAAQNIHVNLWLALAITGLALLVLSSVLEKHGRKWLCNSREYWRQFNEWETR
jgi:hypothetical protein